MTGKLKRPLVLGLGNDLLADDAVGVLAARELKERLGVQADVVESSLSGLALLEVMTGYPAIGGGYSRAIILDAIHTGRAAPGTIVELNPDSLAPVAAPSPHYAGLPEILALARRLELDFPQELVIFAVEVKDYLTVGGAMSPAVRQAVPALVERVRQQVEQWEQGSA